MAQLTPQAFADRLRAKANALAKENKPLKIAAQTVHALRVQRIFHTGIDGASYNTTKELWASDKSLRRKGTHRGKTGKPTKTSYFKSYYDLKRNQGFNPNVVNLRMTNNLQSDFANQNLSPSTDAPPMNSAPIMVSVNHYVERLARAENVKKWKKLTRKYGKFGAFTKEERAVFHRVFNAEMNELLKS